MNESFNERRKHIRIYRNFIITYHEKGSSSTQHDISQVNNVSVGGMNFSSSHPLKSGAAVIIDMQAPFISDPLRLEGFVLDCKEKVPEMIYEIRVQFQDIPEQVLVSLKKIESYNEAKKGD